MAFNGINRYLPPVSGSNIGGEIVTVASFVPNGTSNPTVFTGDFVESVTWSATGVWDVVLSATGCVYIAAFASLKLDTYADRAVHTGAYTASSRTLRVFGSSAGAANNLATTDIVNIQIWARLKDVDRG